MEQKRFSKLDDGFVCVHCGKEVKPLGYSSRNHCPFCLWSRHVDINPGDRASDCKGVMDPVTAEPDTKKGFIITHKCRKCGALKRNKAAKCLPASGILSKRQNLHSNCANALTVRSLT